MQRVGHKYVVDLNHQPNLLIGKGKKCKLQMRVWSSSLFVSIQIKSPSELIEYIVFDGCPTKYDVPFENWKAGLGAANCYTTAND